MRLIILSMLLSLTTLVVSAQKINKPSISLMAIPFASTEEDVLKKYQEEVVYRTAINEINKALFRKGFTNIKDLNGHRTLINKIRNATKNGTQRDRLKKLIEELPVDVVIRAEIIWVNPVDQPWERQTQIMLQAIDKHTATIYASGFVESYARHFLNLGEAVRTALNRDGKADFDTFLLEMEQALMQPRALAFRFEVASVSPINFSSKIKGKAVKDWIKEALVNYSVDSLYKINGESSLSLKGEIYEPVIDNKGNYLQPGSLFCTKLINFLRTKGIKVSYSRVGRQLAFKLEGIY